MAENTTRDTPEPYAAAAETMLRRGDVAGRALPAGRG